MSKLNKFSREERERALRLKHEHREDYPSPSAAIVFIAPKIDHVPPTLNEWV